MESLPIPGPQWRSRTPVRRGHFDPPANRPTSEIRIGNGPSTVQGRINEKLGDERSRDQNVHLQPGMLVIHNRVPRRVVETREYPVDVWPQEFQDRWNELFLWWMGNPAGRTQPEKATWRDRPVVVVLQDDGGVGEDDHRLVLASRVWDVLPEHYAVCRSCGELPPCREEQIDKATAREMAETLRRMAIPAGACMGCGETIGGRQKVSAFPGPNLWRPDLPNGSVRFHARSECSSWAYMYGEQWKAAGKPGFVSAVQQMAMGEG